ncbi:MAG: endonuclease/exonuclease/phosphatase family protein [Candidatus Helarchaeota archaeon]|nr:endonuclease/exonuclease/phosphatase family protein [Candidatus Helarchaeota archaeon]
MSLTNKKIIVIVLLIIPLVVSIVYSVIPIQVSTPTFDDNQVKFMTYNIHFGVGMDDKLDLERIVQNILVEDPDIIGLQEVETGRITSEGIDMAQWIARALGMHYYYYPALNEHAFGCALLSRYPIVNVSAWDMPTIIWDRVLIRGTIRLNNSFWIDVFVTHFGLSKDNRTAQAEFVLSKISLISRPMVLMGDFNLNDSTPEIGSIISVGGFNDTAKDFADPNPPGNTSSSWPAPDGRIDYIFAKGFTLINNSHVVDDMIPGVHAAWEYGSDHLPVVTTLQY